MDAPASKDRDINTFGQCALLITYIGMVLWQYAESKFQRFFVQNQSIRKPAKIRVGGSKIAHKGACVLSASRTARNETPLSIIITYIRVVLGQQALYALQRMFSQDQSIGIPALL